MRLGLVGPLPPPEGGMANQTRQLARLLEGEGIDVRIVRTNEPYRPAWIGAVRGLRGVVRLLPFLASLRATVPSADVVHVMANSGWAWFLSAAPAIHLAARRGVPVIVNYRGGLAREFLASSGPRVRTSLARAAAVVVPSRFLHEVFAQHGIETQIIPNIVDLALFAPRATARDPGHHVVVTRNLESIYGIDTAIEACALLRREFADLRVSIAGAGPERAKLERLCARLGLVDVIRFAGRLSPVEVARLYGEADLALNPSRADNMPNSLLEAAACGVPIVSTRVGGVPHLVEHGHSAWLVAPDDSDSMAQGVAHVLRNTALARSLRENGLALARSYGWTVVGRQWLALYERLAARARPASVLTASK